MLKSQRVSQVCFWYPSQAGFAAGFSQFCPDHGNGDCLLKKLVGVVYKKKSVFCLSKTYVSTSVTCDSDE